MLLCFTCYRPHKLWRAAQDKLWQQAMNEEITAIEKNNTWQLTSLLEGKKTVGVKWIYKTKFNSDGRFMKHKARLVAKGYSQVYGEDYDESFSPEAHLEIVRLFVVFVVHRQWQIFQLDVKSTFLNSALKEEVFVI